MLTFYRKMAIIHHNTLQYTILYHEKAILSTEFRLKYREIEKSLYFLSLIIPLATWSYDHNRIAPKHWISMLLFLRYQLHVTRTPGIRCRVRQRSQSPAGFPIRRELSWQSGHPSLGRPTGGIKNAGLHRSEQSCSNGQKSPNWFLQTQIIFYLRTANNI